MTPVWPKAQASPERDPGDVAAVRVVPEHLARFLRVADTSESAGAPDARQGAGDQVVLHHLEVVRSADEQPAATTMGRSPPSNESEAGASQRALHSWEEHVRLVEALEAHDPDAAEEAARDHVHAAETAAIDHPGMQDEPGTD